MRKDRRFNYIMIRLMMFPMPIFWSMSKSARSVETELHQVFKNSRFEMSYTRAVLKTLFLLFCIYAFWLVSDHYRVGDNTPYYGALFAASVFWKFDVKMGIASDVWRRHGEISDDLRSGKTEWFKLNVWQIAMAILLTSFKNNPLQTTSIICSIFCILYWYFAGGINL